jgi:hypothetical protein
MAPEPIPTAYPSHQCVCMCIPLSELGNGSVKCYRGNEYTPNNRRIVGRVVFYAVCVVSKESRRLVLRKTSCLYVGEKVLKSLRVAIRPIFFCYCNLFMEVIDFWIILWRVFCLC